MIPLGHWITPELLARAGAKFHLRDIFMGPVDRDAYDLIVMTQVIAHLKFRPDEAIAICHEMLKPGGSLIVTALDPACTQCYSTYGADWEAVPVYGTTPASPDMVVCLYTQESLERLLRTSFEQVEVWQPERSMLNFGVCIKDGG